MIIARTDTALKRTLYSHIDVPLTDMSFSTSRLCGADRYPQQSNRPLNSNEVIGHGKR